MNSSFQLCRTSMGLSNFHSNFPSWNFRCHMKCKKCINFSTRTFTIFLFILKITIPSRSFFKFQSTAFYHSISTTISFLCRLKEKSHSSIPFILIFHQNFCNSQLNSCVSIVPTSVHFSKIFRLILHIIFLKNRQCINICPRRNSIIFTIFLIIINCRNHASIYNLKKFNIVFCQKFLN